MELVVITGPTAAGKSALALSLAEKLKGEIISADSMQVYHSMDTGTAKPNKSEQKMVPHHLIDLVSPWEEYSVARFQKDAAHVINEIQQRGSLPFLVGGTGLYIKALLYDYPLSPPPRSKKVRDELRRVAEAKGTVWLHKELMEIDPSLAERIHPHDLRRIIRGLEVYKVSGRPLSSFQAENKRMTLAYQSFGIVLTRPRPQLYQRINDRVEKMFAEGLIDEVRGLLAMGCTTEHTSMQALGYKEVLQYLNGHISLPEAKEAIKTGTRRYAKRQLTWFRHQLTFPWYTIKDDSEFFKLSTELEAIIKEKIL